jgi:RHS repeat-associated protein
MHTPRSGPLSGPGPRDSNPYQLAGNQLYASGLYYLNDQYYTPVLQQFVTVDPLGVGAGYWTICLRQQFSDEPD